MTAPVETLYDALGVSPDANAAAIAAAHKRLLAEFAKDSTAPNPRREALVQTAWTTLSDPARRAEYDASLAARKAERVPVDYKRFIPYVIAGVVVLAAAAYFIMRKPSAPPPPPARPVQEIASDVIRAVGRLQSIEMSGAATKLGVAFAVSGRIMATTCEGLVANAQYLVTTDRGDITARITIVDEELGICKLGVDSSGIPPLLVASTEAKAGDRVFAPVVDEAGKVTLIEGSVKAIVPEPKRKLIELSMPSALANGAPVVDTQGKVVGVVTPAHSYGTGRTLALPGAFVNDAQVRAKAL